MLRDRDGPKIQRCCLPRPRALQGSKGSNGQEEWVYSPVILRQYSLEVCLEQPSSLRVFRSLTFVCLTCRTALDFIKTLYFPDVAPNTRTQPAFSDIEVLYIRTASDTDETVTQHQKAVAEYGFKLIVVCAERIYADSDLAIDITSSGNSSLLIC